MLLSTKYQRRIDILEEKVAHLEQILAVR